MPLPILQAAEPLTIPATVYDRIWIQEIVISAPDPNGEVSARVCLRRFATVGGVAELEQGPGQWVEVHEVLAGSQTDADLAAAVSALMAYVAKVGVENGIVAG